MNNASACNTTPVVTSCCSNVPSDLPWEVTTAGCPAMQGLSGGLHRDPTSGIWIDDQTEWPTLEDPALYKLSCVEVTPGVFNWKFEWSGDFIDGGFKLIPAGCPPLTFNCRMQTADLPAGCDGSAARDFTVRVG